MKTKYYVYMTCHMTDKIVSHDMGDMTNPLKGFVIPFMTPRYFCHVGKKRITERSAMRTLKLTINHLPDSDLSPNSRCHWSAKARAVKAFREEVGWLAKSLWHDQKPMEVARISYEYQLPDERRRDADNLLAMCKPLQDGLIDAGVLFYDDLKHLQIGSITAIQGDKGQINVNLEEV